MAPNVPTDGVSWELFKWVISGVVTGMAGMGTLLATFAKRLWSMPDRINDHARHDDERFNAVDRKFDELSSKLDREHQENRGNFQQVRDDVLTSQRDITTEVRDLRNWLMRRQGADDL